MWQIIKKEEFLATGVRVFMPSLNKQTSDLPKAEGPPSTVRLPSALACFASMSHFMACSATSAKAAF